MEKRNDNPNKFKINDFSDIIKNIETFKQLLKDDKTFINRLIKRGKHFIVFKNKNEYCFAPSRFMGRKDNDHSYYIKDKNGEDNRGSGKDTDKYITGILGEWFDQTEKTIEEQYQSYCKQNNIVATNYKKIEKGRKYWILDEDDLLYKKKNTKNNNYFESNNLKEKIDIDENKKYLDGKKQFKKHKEIESTIRNSKLIRDAKEVFFSLDNPICEICDFSFKKKYGKNYIEAHHKIPLSELNEEVELEIKDLAMICANCHRMIHYLDKDGCIDIEVFKNKFYPKD